MEGESRSELSIEKGLANEEIWAWWLELSDTRMQVRVRQCVDSFETKAIHGQASSDAVTEVQRVSESRWNRVQSREKRKRCQKCRNIGKNAKHKCYSPVGLETVETGWGLDAATDWIGQSVCSKMSRKFSLSAQREGYRGMLVGCEGNARRYDAVLVD